MRSCDLSNVTRANGLSGVSTGHGRKAKLQALKHVPSRILWFPILLNSGQQFRHRTLESVVEPTALQRHLALPLFEVDLHSGLLIQPWTARAQGTRRAHDGRAVLLSQTRMTIEADSHLSTGILDSGGRQGRRAR